MILTAIQNRRNTILGTFFVFLLSMSMLSFGLDIFRSNPRDELIIKVNDQEIPFDTFYRERKMLEERYQQMFGPNYSQFMKMMAGNLNNQVIDKLVNDTLIRQLAVALDFSSPSAKLLREKLQEIFPKGFSSESYLSLLQNLGMTAKQFEDEVRSSLINEQFVKLIDDISFSTKHALKNEINKVLRKYNITLIEADPKLFTSDRIPSESEINKFIKKEKSVFILPSKVKYNFLIISDSTFPNLIKFENEDIETYYTTNVHKYQTVPKVKLQKIKINFSNEEEKKKIIKEAQKLITELSEGLSFDLAVKAFTVEATRSLGISEWISPNESIPELEEVIWRLDVASGPEIVETKDSIYVVKVIDYLPPKDKPLSEVKDLIITELKKEIAPSFMNTKSQELFKLWNSSNLSLLDFCKSNSLKCSSSNSLLDSSKDPENVPIGLTQKIINEAEREDNDDNKFSLDFNESQVITEVIKYQEPQLPKLNDEVREKASKLMRKADSDKSARKQLLTVLDVATRTSKPLADITLDPRLVKSGKILILQDQNSAKYLTPELKERIESLNKTPFLIKKINEYDNKFFILSVNEFIIPDAKTIDKEKDKIGEKLASKESELLKQSILNSLKASSEIIVPPNISSYGNSSDN
jgi:peptidyl-prolyl cis-trans isomerase D